MSQLSKYFSEFEFLYSWTAVHQKVLNIWDEPSHRQNAIKLCKKLDEVREIFGPLKITSGYRNRRLNALVGGARNSKHLTGQAADIYPSKNSIEALYQWALKNWAGGVAINKRLMFVHFDTGPKRTWSY
jgi:uncharacterized protein YcbK (DUF882 family)